MDRNDDKDQKIDLRPVCQTCGGSQKLVSDDGEWSCYSCVEWKGGRILYSKEDVEALVAIAIAGVAWQKNLRERQRDLLELERDKLKAALQRIANPDFEYATDDDEDTPLSMRIADAKAALA